MIHKQKISHTFLAYFLYIYLLWVLSLTTLSCSGLVNPGHFTFKWCTCCTQRDIQGPSKGWDIIYAVAEDWMMVILVMYFLVLVFVEWLDHTICKSVLVTGRSSGCKPLLQNLYVNCLLNKFYNAETMLRQGARFANKHSKCKLKNGTCSVGTVKGRSKHWCIFQFWKLKYVVVFSCN